MKVLGIIFYAIAGFFVYMASLFVFINDPRVFATPKQKLQFIGGACIPLLLTLLAGWACGGFRKVKRNTGIVILSGAGVTALAGLTFLCLSADPAYRKLYPDHKLESFSDYAMGFSLVAILILAGILLIMNSTKDGEQDVQPDGGSDIIDPAGEVEVPHERNDQ